MNALYNKGFLLLQFAATFLLYFTILRYITNRFLSMSGLANLGFSILIIIILVFLTQLTTEKIKDLNRSNS